MKTLTLYRGTNGLNTKVDPVRLRFDPESGVTDLSAAFNIDIDDSGRITRRRGKALIDATAMHSLFSSGDVTLAVRGNSLGLIGMDPFSFTGIRNVTMGARMSYAAHFNGAQQIIYYCNGYENGIVRDGASYPWVAGTYSGPDTSRTLSNPPLGHLLALYNGRMYIATDHVVRYSEAFAHSWFDMARSFLQFPSRIRGLAVALDGIFVGTETDIFALTGTTPDEFVKTKVADYAMVEGTIAYVDAARIGNGEMRGMLPMFATTGGICVGGIQGQLINLTQRKIEMPQAQSGAAVYTGEKYICVLEG